MRFRAERSEAWARAAGFTLIEILVVIAVVSILASLVSPMVFRNVGDAKITAARAQIEIFALALDAYRLDNDAYPTSAVGLEALRIEPAASIARGWRGPYLRKDVPHDPWDRPYVYRSPGVVNAHAYDLLSLGRDGTEGGEGEDADIVSWQ